MNRPTTTFKKLITTSTLILAAFLMAFAVPLQVKADSYQEEIDALQAQIDNYQDEAGKLARAADTLQNKVNGLQAQINSIQSKVDLSEAKLKKLNADIKKTEEQITQQTKFLGEMLVKLYVESDVSPIEALAGAGSLGDYVDQQAYKSSIRTKLSGSIKSIKQLKVELSEKKVDVERILKDQKAQQEQVQAVQNEQASLLARTRGEEAAYQNLIQDAESEIDDLRAKIAQELGGTGVGPGDPNKGGYQYNDTARPGWSFWDCYPDRWGMCARQCVSYTAWKVEQHTGYMPYWGGHGDANQWPDNARAEGIPVSSTPKENTVAISYVGGYGHAMWVEQVSGDQIYVSQYNYNLDGEYSEMWAPASGLTFIYFGE